MKSSQVLQKLTTLFLCVSFNNATMIKFTSSAEIRLLWDTFLLQAFFNLSLLNFRVYSDLVSQRPVPIVLAQEPTESSVTWTRPAKPNKIQVFHDIMEQLGTLISNSKFITKV